MVSKVDILKNNVQLYFSSDHEGKEDGAEWHTNNAPAENIFKAMDQYSEAISIGFAEFILKNYTAVLSERNECIWISDVVSDEKKYTSSDLYQLYLKIK